MHPTPFQLWWRYIKTNFTNDSGSYNINDLSLYKDRMMKDRFVNSYTTRATSKECPRGRSVIWQLCIWTLNVVMFSRSACIVRWTLNYHYLLQRAAKRFIRYGISVHPSVCLSVRPSHSGIVSKRRDADGCDLHHLGSPVSLVFCCQE